jgi:phosphonoacetaldehyde hydrolase
MERKGIMSKISVVILDWAGTAIDFGSLAPVDAFAAAFEDCGVRPTTEEIREPMGLAKRTHIERMLEGGRLSGLWREKHGRCHTQVDIDRIYARFEPALYGVLEKYAEPLPGVIDTVRKLREMDVAIGSTTGYTRNMMNIVTPLAARAGYAPDALVCPDDIGGVGRPYPYMLWRNLEELGIESIAATLKIGDTAADIQEGKNAGCISVGVIKGSSMLGLSEAEYEALSDADKPSLFDEARRRYTEAGADYVIDDITEATSLIRWIVGGSM